MVKCAVLTCKNDTRKHTKQNSSVTFHRFPKDQTLRNKWIDALKKTEWEPNIWSKVCSLHFPNNCIYETKNKLHKLITDAVPSLFLDRSLSPDPNLKETASSNSGFVKYIETLPDLQQKSPDSVQTKEAPHLFLPNLDDTPRKQKLKRDIVRLQDTAKRRRLRCNALYATRRRLKRKVEDFTQLLKELKEKRLINQEHINLLESCEVSAAALIKRMIRKGKEYSPELRTFALTLHFYSPKAYSYIRNTFNTCLPHPSTIRKWYQSLDASPGFTAEALKVLHEKVKSSDKKILCSLVTDEISIRQLKEFDGSTVHGYVDFGVGINIPGDSTVLCTQALVFLLVAINDGWKIPVGYFLVNGLTGEQRANLVKICLSNCHETGVEVVSMTFDGCPSNIAMARELGCSFDKDQLKTDFSHPVTNQPVYVFLDPCHMVKLVRNTLESHQILEDNEGNPIKWQYFVELNNLQTNEKFHLANKLTLRHIHFKNQIMNVRLAVQLLSARVAKAIEFCDKKLHLINFTNSNATVKFINVMNSLFDVLNSRKFPDTIYKAPMNEKNESKYLEFLENTKNYLEKLMISKNKQPIMKSRNKIGFLGLCVCINSMKELYNILIKQEKTLTFLPMYKISQDHLENFFSVIRSHGGFNNNPSATQFKAIYKKLLVHMELKENFRGNCTSLEHITLLTCSSSADLINVTIKGHRSESQNDTADERFMSKDDELNLPEGFDSILSQQVISYISGYVTRYLLSKLDCTDCLAALVTNVRTYSHAFIEFKDRKGLIYPSEDIIKVCNAAEKVIKSNIDSNNPADRDPRNMVTKTLKLFIGIDIFSSLNAHLYEQEPCSNHLIHLLRAVVQKYVQIRVNYLVRKSNFKKTKRQLFNKLTLFSGQ